ncbi:MAG TPA: DUF2612 domain-containing protein [Acidimicrobiales bacterium]|nr:DUF2612 domain-containing protein [Acidimicrobiales bacterium]
MSKYLALVPSANRQQPRFTASLSAALAPLLDVMSVAASLPAAFDIDEAVGVQLDAVGVRVGLSRRLGVPIEGVYFALDVDGVGLDEGVWLGPNDPTEALAALDDGTYRLFLRLKVQANTWSGSLEDAQRMLQAAAPPGSAVFVQDNFDMSMTVGVSGVVPSRLFIKLLEQANEWLRPAAVDSSVVIVTSTSGAPIFGLDSDNDYLGGLDRGAWAVTY